MKEISATVSKRREGGATISKRGGATISKGGCYEYPGPADWRPQVGSRPSCYQSGCPKSDSLALVAAYPESHKTIPAPAVAISAQ
jgi:hypothetical protein